MTCDTCLHSKMAKQMNLVGLYCHRHPPTTHVLPTGPGQVQMLGLWPPVDKLDSCGEYHYDACARAS